LKSENNSYLITTSSTQILHLRLAICCIIKIIVNCTKSEKQGNQSTNRLVFASIFAPKKPKKDSKNLGGKNSYFLKNSSTKNLIFYLRICCKSSTSLMQIVKRKETLFAREQQQRNAPLFLIISR
jgi:hypothetical protein